MAARQALELESISCCYIKLLLVLPVVYKLGKFDIYLRLFVILLDFFYFFDSRSSAAL